MLVGPFEFVIRLSKHIFQFFKFLFFFKYYYRNGDGQIVGDIKKYIDMNSEIVENVQEKSKLENGGDHNGAEEKVNGTNGNHYEYVKKFIIRSLWKFEPFFVFVKFFSRTTTTMISAAVQIWTTVHLQW